MSHPSSSKGNLMSSENIIPQETNSKKMIIITRHNLHSAKSHTSKLTYEEGPYSIQCDMGKNTERMDKQIIDNTVKILQETIKKKEKNRHQIENIHQFNRVINQSYQTLLLRIMI